MKVYAQEYNLIEKESESVQQNVLMFFEIIWMYGWHAGLAGMRQVPCAQLASAMLLITRISHI